MREFRVGDFVRHRSTGEINKITALSDLGDSWYYVERLPRIAVDLSNYELVPNQEVTTKNEVTHPDHYQNKLGVEVIDIINEYFRDNYNLGNVLKYLLRADKKGNRQRDLEKALQYLTWEVKHGRDRSD